MLWFYLVLAILMNDGQPRQTVSTPFQTLSACNAAGAQFVSFVKDHPEIKQGGWYCQQIDFDAVDPVPQEEPTPGELPEGHPHIPGKNEA